MFWVFDVSRDISCLLFLFEVQDEIMEHAKRKHDREHCFVPVRFANRKYLHPPPCSTKSLLPKKLRLTGELGISQLTETSEKYPKNANSLGLRRFDWQVCYYDYFFQWPHPRETEIPNSKRYEMNIQTCGLLAAVAEFMNSAKARIYVGTNQLLSIPKIMVSP